VLILLVLWVLLPLGSPLILWPAMKREGATSDFAIEKLIRAREQAEKILRQRPGSIIAHYALALVFHDEEGNLPRSLYHLGKEKKSCSALWRVPGNQHAQSWHRKFLEEEQKSW